MRVLELQIQTEATSLLPLEEEPSRCSRFSRWMGRCVEKIRRFSRLTSQVALLALDTLYFVGKVSTALPTKLTQTTLVALSFVGVIALPYSIHSLVKSIRDGLYAMRCGNKFIFILASSRAIETSSNLAMTGLGFIAALSGLIGGENLQTELYQSMIAWGIATVALGTLNTVVGLGVERHMLRVLKAPEAEATSSALLQALVTTPEPSPSFQQASQLRLCMDKDTLDKLMQTLSGLDPLDTTTPPKLYEVVVSNLYTQQNVNLVPKLGLTLVGDGLMAAEKYFTPTSVQAACINLSMASAYTARLVAEIACEVRQRRHLETAAAPAHPYAAADSIANHSSRHANLSA